MRKNDKWIIGLVMGVVSFAILFPFYKPYGISGYVSIGMVSLLVLYMSQLILKRFGESQKDKTERQNQLEALFLEGQEKKEKQYDQFEEYSKDLQQNILDALKGLKEFQNQSLQQMLVFSRNIEGLTLQQQEQNIHIAEKLSDFTHRLANLFEERLKEDFADLKIIKAGINQTLEEMNLENQRGRQRYEEQLEENKLIFNNLAVRLENLYQEENKNSRKQWSDIKTSVQDTLEDTQSSLEGIIKSQKKDFLAVLEELSEQQNGILTEISKQSQEQVHQTELLRTLQEEVLSMNREDVELMSRILERI